MLVQIEMNHESCYCQSFAEIVMESDLGLGKWQIILVLRCRGKWQIILVSRCRGINWLSCEEILIEIFVQGVTQMWSNV